MKMFIMHCIVVVSVVVIVMALRFIVMSWISDVLFCQVEPQYEKTIVVDSYEQIDDAVSNVVSDVRRRNFEVVQLRVLHRSLNGKFKVECGGTDRSRLKMAAK